MLIRLGRPHGLAVGALSITFGIGATTLLPKDAAACGCFAPPDPSVPVVQAGEEIIFSHEPAASPDEEGTITAHIKILYEGRADEFGWLLPVPAVPEMELGVEELFVQMLNTTQPKYRLNTFFDDACGDFSGGLAGGPPTDSGGENSGGRGAGDVVVKQDSVGPFDFAVLRADDRTAMFDWLNHNGYFIPLGLQSEGENDVVSRYIRPGAFFLALRLRAGSEVGDLQPVVLRYKSKLPEIPIVLTSVAANPDMGVRVWVLGEARAIPRNYRHTVINDEFIDWFNFGANYNEVIINAANEAPDGQTFVTEYAGSTDRMQNVLNWPGRFGNRGVLSGLTDVAQYLQALRANGFTWDSALTQALRRVIPYPDRLAAEGISEELFYDNIDWYLGGYRDLNPEPFVGYVLDFDPVALTNTLWERIVEPTREAGALFDKFPKMTRLYTTLSPEEMTRDPVFSFNPSLPDVDNEHNATLRQLCSQAQPTGESVLELPDGRAFFVRDADDWLGRNRVGVPYSRRIERLNEEGPPVVEVNNASRISQGDESAGGCSCSAAREDVSGPSAAGLFAAALCGLMVVARRRRR